MKYRRVERQKDRTRINEAIRVPRVRVIGPEGNQLGVLAIRDAQDVAREHGLDLVEISPNAVPPVCKILDYGKHKYELKKKAQEAKKSQTTTSVKEVKFRPKTDVHDVGFKVKNIVKFIEQGNKVKITVFFRGREMAYTNQGNQLLQKIYSLVEEVCQIEQQPAMEGRFMSMIVAPRTAKA